MCIVPCCNFFFFKVKLRSGYIFQKWFCPRASKYQYIFHNRYYPFPCFSIFIQNLSILNTIIKMILDNYNHIRPEMLIQLDYDHYAFACYDLVCMFLFKYSYKFLRFFFFFYPTRVWFTQANPSCSYNTINQQLKNVWEYYKQPLNALWNVFTNKDYMFTHKIIPLIK